MLAQVQSLLNQPNVIQDVATFIKKENIITTEADVFQSFQAMGKVFDLLMPLEKRNILELIIQQVIVNKQSIKIVWTELGSKLYKLKTGEEKASTICNINLARKRGRIQIIMPDGEIMIKRVDDRMMKALSRAFTWQDMLNKNPKLLIKELAKKEKWTELIWARLLR